MFLWFVIVAPVAVAEVFRSPMVDYRLVAIGAIVPLVDIGLGATIVHTLVGAVCALGAVMAVTTGRRLVRRRLLGIPIGMFFHLVLDGSWTSAELFWWPAFGLDSIGGMTAPEVGRGAVLPIVLEVAAIAVGFVAWRRYGLDERDNRATFVRRGHLTRAAFQ